MAIDQSELNAFNRFLSNGHTADTLEDAVRNDQRRLGRRIVIRPLEQTPERRSRPEENILDFINDISLCGRSTAISRWYMYSTRVVGRTIGVSLLLRLRGKGL